MMSVCVSETNMWFNFNIWYPRDGFVTQETIGGELVHRLNFRCNKHIISIFTIIKMNYYENEPIINITCCTLVIPYSTIF